MKHMMVIIPVNTQVNKAEDITQKYWYNWFQICKFTSMRRFHFQYHDGYNNRNYTVAKCFYSAFCHKVKLGN